MDFQIDARGPDYWAKTGGEPAFFVGRRVRYGGRVGLINDRTGPAYVARHYRPDFGIWADLIAPSIACEGGRFCALNSYDRARFSFGIGQFGAHVPEGDFIGLMRRLLRMPEAAAYFPELTLRDGRIWQHARGHPRALEQAGCCARLALSFNPRRGQVDAQEAVCAARLIHWTRASRPARLAQIAQMAATFRAQLQRAGTRLSIRTLPAPQAIIIADLLHHGRAGRGLWTRLGAALAGPDPFAALLQIGARRWATRVDRLRAAILAQPDLIDWFWDTPRGDMINSRS